MTTAVFIVDCFRGGGERLEGCLRLLSWAVGPVFDELIMKGSEMATTRRLRAVHDLFSVLLTRMLSPHSISPD